MLLYILTKHDTKITFYSSRYWHTENYDIPGLGSDILLILIMIVFPGNNPGFCYL
jgi:hypothetical protein